MEKKMTYWITTWITTMLIVAAGIVAGPTYLSGTQPAVEGFARLGYPLQLRILLGLAKPLGAMALLIPGWPRLKEWAYAGFTFAWIAAVPAHYLVHEIPSAVTALGLLVILTVPYFTRPETHRVPTRAAAYV